MLQANSEKLSLIFASDSEEMRELCRTIKKFASGELSVDTPDSLHFKRETFDAMGRLGLTGMSVPEDFGGTEIGALATAGVLFELAREQLGPAIYLSVHSMVCGLVSRFRSTEAHQLALSELAAGRALAAFGLTEAEAGSDAAALVTKAVREGDHYLLSGEKIYITSAGAADLYLIFARRRFASDQGYFRIFGSVKHPGLSCGAPEKKMGCEGSPIASVVLERCPIPEVLRLGAEGDGYKIALAGLQGGRINIAACACGLASKSLELTAAHLTGRKQFQSMLSEFQGLQFMVADMYGKFRSAVLLTRDAALRHEQVQPIGQTQAPETLWASVAKCVATDNAMSITTDAVQLFGGAGYLWDYGVERLMRDAKMLQIVEGTNQIQRILIARDLLGRKSG